MFSNQLRIHHIPEGPQGAHVTWIIVEVLGPKYVTNEYVDQMRRQTKRSGVRNQDNDQLCVLIFITSAERD